MGAILGELLLHKPLFSADEESRVLTLIIDELGPPRDDGLMFMQTLPLWKEFTRIMHPTGSVPGKTESAILHACSRNSWDLVSKMLSYCPSQRVSAGAALEHPFFSESPSACDPQDIRLPASGEFCHGLGMREKRERDKQNNDNVHGPELPKKARAN
jgi:serine/threonine protein kinase